jgi:antitoxin (DNA-binding transcriptional repressor) of toxin-antitoxin stability system
LTNPKKYVFFTQMKATLTELRRETSRILGPVIHASKKVVLTEHGRNIAAIVPMVEPDRKRALRLLAAIGPVEMPESR